jgi:hypothetical protein
MCDDQASRERDLYCQLATIINPGICSIAGVTTSECDGGYTSLTLPETNASSTYFYRGGSLVAIVNVSHGRQTCEIGPAVFNIPKCGGLAPLCSSIEEAGSDVSSDAGGE